VIYAAGSSGGFNVLGVLPFVLLIAVLYFLMIRPQQRRRREAQELQSRLGAGDEVVTIGGLYGTIVDADDETVTLEISPGVHARYARPAIARVVSRAEAEEEEEEEEEEEYEEEAEESAEADASEDVAARVVDRGKAKD
jgi:preprotein translocase subunit YajC